MLIAVTVSMHFLTACRQEIVVFLPLAAREPKQNIPYRLLALTVWRAQLDLIASPQAVTINTPDRLSKGGYAASYESQPQLGRACVVGGRGVPPASSNREWRRLLESMSSVNLQTAFEV